MDCLFVSDLHGHIKKYETLFAYIDKKDPDAVFFGGDLLPFIPDNGNDMDSFIQNIFFSPIKQLKQRHPNLEFFVILGNDDPKKYESIFIEADNCNLIKYVHQKTIPFSNYYVTGYSFVPPTPFQLKDWERYDVSQFVDVGVIPLEEGYYSIPVDINTIRFKSIQKDLDELVKNASARKTIYLFHSPPYNTFLDRAALDGKKFDHAPVDVHIGSIAIKRFIDKYQPFITLHGHVHESSKLTGEWKQIFNRTISFSAAFTEEKLAIINFNTANPHEATRTLISI